MSKYKQTIKLTDDDKAVINHYAEADRKFASYCGSMDAEYYWTDFWDDDAWPCSENDTYTITAHFKNGYEMDIKLCGSRDSAPWVEAVLFNARGGECCCTEPADDIEFKGTWTLEYNDDIYTVTVK